MRKNQNAHLQGNIIFTHNNFISRYLENGAICDLNVNGFSTSVLYKAVPPPNHYWMITRMLFYYSSNTAFEEGNFANLPTLDNGVSILCNNVEIMNWKDNICVQTSMYDAVGRAVQTKVDRSIVGKMSFWKFGELIHGLKVEDNINGFGFKIQDDLSSLDQFRVRIQGIEYNKEWPY